MARRIDETKKSDLEAQLEDVELQIEQAADQGDDDMAAYWDTERQLLMNQLKKVSTK